MGSDVVALFAVVAVACAVPAGFCVAVLLRAVRTGPRAPRATYLPVAAGVTLASVVFALVAGLRAGGVGDTALVLVSGIGFALACVVIFGGLLMLPTIVPPTARASRVLDGLLLTACAFYVAWSLILEPAHRAGRGGALLAMDLDADCLAVTVPMLVIAAVLGGVLISAVHLWRTPTTALAGLAGAAQICLGAGTVVLATAGYSPKVLAPVGGCLLGAGFVSMALGGLRAQRARRAQVPAPAAAGVAISTVPVAAALAACLWRLSTGAPLDRGSVFVATIIGGLLAAQQGLSRRDIRRYLARLADSEAHFREMAHTDALTGLANRRELIRILDTEAVGGPACVLLAIDLDGFKYINDVRGHDVGDDVLVEVARRLRSNVRPGDCAARLGGDEFAVLMWAKPSEATTVAERILGVLSKPYELASGSVFVSASIGMAGCATADSIDSLLRNADLALRSAKVRGKNRYESYDATYDELVSRRSDLEQELRGAVERGELMLVYQPIATVAEGYVAGVEALLRWHHPRLGSVSPAEFIPVAEEAGLIHELGTFVVHEACHQLSRWIADGHDLWLSINASVRELHTPEYAHRVVEVLRTHRVPAEKLVIEVTEHAMALDVDQLKDRLSALREAGVKVALDDFGSGYSSLNLLRTLPVDILKIDHALLDAEDTRSTDPLADIVVELGKRLQLDVIAEGVVTPGQRDLLHGCGCRYAQGELFGWPLPAERVEALFGEQIGGSPRIPAQSVGSVDSAREIRQS
ncbi:hypothetical protein Val02_25790 [Virgisporangium aliadipatigenens]|uniref:Bifunctional diguanylate cyclase/phosphodiesterase n=1 Tax=Virgisporangium aliadipatigenens TaxID=741659 RepID=A0A8J3YKC7_9ACTN|nr:hypothetical protein Val02_25790 [Virgisporangium aliadipatigenens]